MSVRRTIAQSSAGLLLLAAFAAGPAVAFGDAPATPGVPGPSDGGCATDAVPQAFVSPSSPKVGETVTITGQCFPERGAIVLNVSAAKGGYYSVEATVGGSGSVTATFTPEVAGEHTFIFNYEGGQQPADGAFNVQDDGSDDTGDNEDGDESGGSDDGDSGSDTGEGGADEGDDSAESGEGGDDSSSGDSDQDQGDDSQNSDDSEGSETGGSGNGEDSNADDSGNGGDSEPGDNSGTGGSGSDDEQNQDSGNSDESGNAEGSEEEQQGGDSTASGSPTKPFPGDEQGGDTSASAANDGAASRGSAPAQPPAAPGSATNDFPAAQQEATADQKQSAALAVLMTKLFAGGVSTGSVGTTPDQARAVIDPSADASEIEVPAGSDNGSSSDSGSGSESSDGDALAATGSNMLVPAGIAAAAILLGAGLKIHQIRRGL